MRRRPQPEEKQSIPVHTSLLNAPGNLGLVLSGGGSRAAYQAGALRALLPYLKNKADDLSVIIGSSIGAINGLIVAACLKEGLEASVVELESLWRERTFRNTFAGTPSGAFLRAIRMAARQYMSPGPSATSQAIFDPSPLMARIDQVLTSRGGLSPQNRAPSLQNVAVMTTIEGTQRKPLLFLSSHKKLEAEALQGASFDICYVDTLNAKHGFASAALPSVLPPVELDSDAGKIRLVDGGISQNVPVDPAVRMGAERVIVVDVSGRDWWLNRYNEAHDTRPTWEVPAEFKTYCMRPPLTFVSRCKKPLGPLLKESVAGSSAKFMRALGATWPVFKLLKKKMGEEIAYEVMTYVALDPDYIHGLMERGFSETTQILKDKSKIEFERSETYEQWAESL